MFSFELSFRAIPIINPVTDHTFPTGFQGNLRPSSALPCNSFLLVLLIVTFGIFHQRDSASNRKLDF